MNILFDVIRLLGIKKPVDVTIKTRKGKDCDAYYLPRYSDRTAKLIGHKIVIYALETTRPFDTLLAHELIHAAQEENRREEFHGDFFREKATMLEYTLGLREIYLHDVDEE